MDTFQKFLRNRIDALRLTPRQVATSSGVDEGELSRLLKGKRRPTLLSIQRLSPVLQVPMTDLLMACGSPSGSEKMPNPSLPDIPVGGECVGGRIKMNPKIGAIDSRMISESLGILCSDNSAAPLAKSGDYVLYNTQIAPKSGDRVIVKFKNRGIFFKAFVVLKDAIILQSLDGGDMDSANADDLEFMYKVVAVRFK
jgi:transcriptional regulator with XRE-family HTH domain